MAAGNGAEDEVTDFSICLMSNSQRSSGAVSNQKELYLYNEEDSETLKYSGGNISVNITADNFIAWHNLAEMSLRGIYSNPDEVCRYLRLLIYDFGARYANARKDDPYLPSFFRQYLGADEEKAI